MTDRLGQFSKRKKPRPGEVDLPFEDRFDAEEEVRQKPIQFHLLMRILSFLKPHRNTVLLILFFIVLTTLVAVCAGVIFVREATKYVKLGDFRMTLYYALGIIGLGGLACILDVIHDRLSMRLGQSVVHDLRMNIFRHLQKLSISFFDRTKQGSLISRMTSDIGVMEQVFAWALPIALWSILQVVVVFGVMIWLNWRLSLIVSFVIPALATTTRVFQPWVIQAWREMRLRVSRLTSNLAENMQGIRVVQAFTREQENLRTFDELGRRHYVSRMRAVLRFHLYFGIIGIIGALGNAAVYIYTGHQGLASGMEAQDVVAFIAALGMFFGPIRQLGDLYNQALSAMAGGERIFGLLDTEPDVKDLPDALAIPHIEGAIVFEDVNFAYNPDTPILRDINITAGAGETVALVGPTGAGKSTIINLLCRFYEATEGRVLVDGHDVRHLTLHSLHSQMGIVLQESYLFSGTVMDNIKFGQPETSDSEVIEAARTIGAHETIANLRDGYQTEVSERGESLSAGERQLVCFTRAMVAKPSILILDEATSSVDSQTEHRIQEALERLVERRTTFVVAHRLSTVRNADQVLVIEDGRIVERGTHDELLTKGGNYTRMYTEFLRSG